MDLVEHNELRLPGGGAPPVKHRPQNLGGHHETRGIGVDGDIARHQAHISELLRQLPVFLIAQCLER